MEYSPEKDTDFVININYKLDSGEVVSMPVKVYTTHETGVFWTSAGIIRLGASDKKDNEIEIPVDEIKLNR